MIGLILCLPDTFGTSKSAAIDEPSGFRAVAANVRLLSL
jgi:hypothetical protein